METLDSILALLRCDGASRAEWSALLDSEAVFEMLGMSLSGRENVAARLAATGFSRFTWSRMDRPGIVLSGKVISGSSTREMVISIVQSDGRITRFSQQGPALPRQPNSPMVMDAALRARFDQALALKHPMVLAYVDSEGAPHLSLRGSLRTFGPDKLCMWARNAEGGLVAAIETNPRVALLFRDESSRAMYQLQGRARVAADETTRAEVFEGSPHIEQQHDFARLGAAIVIELDLVEGWAGFGPSGQVDPVRLVRA